MTASATNLGRVIAATGDAVAAHKANAQVVFRASAVAQDAVASTVSLGEYRVEVDEPPALGGENKAPNPVEYYLASLLSCQVVTWRIWAEKLGIKVGQFTAHAEGDLDVQGFFGLDDAVRPGFNEVRLVITVSGTGDAGALPRIAGSGRRALPGAGSDPKRHSGDNDGGDRANDQPMIFIVVKFETKPEWTERWPELVASFTAATRAEQGNLWFEWSRSLDNPAEYVLVEAFRDGDAGGVHVNSDHFKQAMQELPQALRSTPKIISQTIDATGWSEMGEMSRVD